MTSIDPPHRRLMTLAIITILLTGAATPSDRARAGEPLWAQPQAQILPEGDLKWQPKPFRLVKGESVRYIDYQAGKDSNDGRTRDTAWKHHPWDAQATANAKACSGIHTYIFKRGVVYRGFLQADESGREGQPIRLTSDPDWGQGQAMLVGSMQVTGGWKQASSNQVPDAMPEAGKVWYMDLGADFEPWAIWQRDTAGQVTRIHLARTPNWQWTTRADPKSQWRTWDWPTKEDSPIGRRQGRDDALEGKPKDFFDGAYCWSEWGGGIWGAMSLQYRSPVIDYDPETGAIDRVVISPIFDGWVTAGDRYYLEKHPAFLDAPGEYYYEAPRRWFPTAARQGFPWEGRWIETDAEHPGRLYVRLPGDRNPNETVLELGRRDQILRILDQDHIEVTGLTFAFTNVPYRPQETNLPGWDSYDIHLRIALEPYLHPAAIMLGGDTSDIRIANNTFRHVAAAVKGHAWRSPNAPANEVFKPIDGKDYDEFARIRITDNDIEHVDHEGIDLTGNLHKNEVIDGPRLGRVAILRNRLHRISLRPKQSKNSPAIHIGAGVTLADIAGNEMVDCIGMGIYSVGGKGGGDERSFPLTRVLIYNNRADHVLLGANDWGAIAAWQGGPSYIFNNVASNAVGYKNCVYQRRKDDSDIPRYSSNAYPYYGDGTYKSYWFNNIGYSDYDPTKTPYRTQAGFMFVLGFQNYVFNNSLWNLYSGSSGSIGNRGGYMGNIFARMASVMISAGAKGDLSVAGGGEQAVRLNMGAVSTVAFTENLLADTLGAERIAKLGVGTWRDNTYQKILAALAKEQPLAGDVGVVVKDSPFRAADRHDFRPSDTANKARGRKVFVPWGLYATVGEWQFNRNATDPRVILGEHFYMTDEYVNRKMYYEIPRGDLLAPNAGADSYVPGPLSNWLKAGALHFDGADDYAVLTHKQLVADYVTSIGFYDQKQKDGTIKRAAGEPLTKLGDAIRRARQAGKTDKATKLQKQFQAAKAKGLPDKFVYAGGKRRTLNIDTGNLLIEAYLRTEKGHTSGTVAGKMGQSGYALLIDADGKARLAIAGGGDREGFASHAPVNDGKWHHVLAEFDRGNHTVRIYVDGKASGEFESKLPTDASLANTEDFLVGKGADGNHFAGDLDFLRVCRGTLADAQTTIEELYAWQFHGPFLGDLAGNRRDWNAGPAGALGR